MVVVATITVSALAAGCPGTIEFKEDFTGVPLEIIGPSCAKSLCHDSTSKAGRLDLSPDEGLRGRLVDVPSFACGGKLVDTANPEQSVLYTKCMPNPPCGTQMPQTGSLDPSEIEDLLTWIKSLKP
jgi:hypothetical protein